METFLIKALQLLLSLSILVIFHEFGHFIFARMFKIRVEKFYLFFDPWFSLFKFKPKNSDTEYGIGWLPLGGYVKISGMIDESMDKEQMAQPAQPWEFRAKPAWQRLLVMVAGVIFNFLLAIFILSMMLFHWGDTYLPTKNMTYGMEYSEQVKAAGFKDGDVLISADGKELKQRSSVLDMNTLIEFIDAKNVTVERGRQRLDIQLPAGFGDSVVLSKQAPYMPYMPTVIDSVFDNSAAMRAGLQKGDSITAVNGIATSSFVKIRKQISENLNKDVTISLVRAGVDTTLTANVDSTGLIGFTVLNPAVNYKIEKVDYGFFASFPQGISMGINTLKAYVAQMRFVFNKDGLSNLGGFGALGSMFPPTWDWVHFWSMTAFLSIVLAFMNILPIPALDGGHIMFLMYEVITRRKPNEKVMEYAQIGGMILLFGLLLIANGNDIIRAIFG